MDGCGAYLGDASKPQFYTLSLIRHLWHSAKPFELSAGICLLEDGGTYAKDVVELGVLRHFVGLSVKGISCRVLDCFLFSGAKIFESGFGLLGCLRQRQTASALENVSSERRQIKKNPRNLR